MIVQVLGGLLFLPIPVVLYLFVFHPEPLGWSLGFGVLLMIGHRFVARPWMGRVAADKCLWCNGLRDGEGESLILKTGGGEVEAWAHRNHGLPVNQFFGFANRFRTLLRVGIFPPLAILLGTLLGAALGYEVPLDSVTNGFQLVIGCTVSFAAWSFGTLPAGDSIRIPFPVHNFFLLGLRNLLWIFRLVGLWWILKASLFFLR